MIAANIFQFAVGSLPLLALVTLYSSHSLINVLALLVPLIALSLVCTGIGFLVSALYVFFRDLPYFYELVVFALWMSSPVFYPSEIVPAHFDMRWAKPLDEELLHEVLKQYPIVLTVEDGVIQGGFGSAILEFVADNGYTNKIARLGMPDKVVEHGEQRELHAECGFDPLGIARTVAALCDLELIPQTLILTSPTQLPIN
jgi:hypothetical protein